MGAWGTSLYSDDLTSDLRGDFRDLIGQGLGPEDAVARLMSEYREVLDDADEAHLFWLALADTAWRLGRPTPELTSRALTAIESGVDLQRWTDSKDLRRRETVLAELATRLKSVAPPPKRVQPRHVAQNDWALGELIAFRLASGSWTLFRVIGHHVDKGGRHAICEPLDWHGTDPPRSLDASRLVPLHGKGPSKSTQFLLGEPRKKQDVARFVRTGIVSSPSQVVRGFTVLVFPYVDRLLLELFGLE